MAAVRLAAAVALAGWVAACGPASPDESVVARIGDRTVTMQEVDERWRAANPAQHAEVTQTTYDARRRVLEEIVAESLLRDAASDAGVSIDEYEASEIRRRTPPVTDGDIQAFYETNRAQLDDTPFEELAPRIRGFLDDQRRTEARHALLAELEREGGTPVQVSLEPPRRHVEVRDTDPALGPPSAPVTLLEFSDYECPFCQRVVPTLKQLREHYGDQLRVVWKDFPLTQIHPNAFKAAEAAHCAGDQGHYWEYHDLLFANQQALAPERLIELAGTLPIDEAAFRACLDSSRHAARVQAGLGEGSRLGVNSTPTILINGRRLAGAHPYETFAAIIEEELARAR